MKGRVIFEIECHLFGGNYRICPPELVQPALDLSIHYNTNSGDSLQNFALSKTTKKNPFTRRDHQIDEYRFLPAIIILSSPVLAHT